MKAEVWTDGGGNVGTPGAAACVIKVEGLEPVTRAKKLPEEVSNNVAEYEGVIIGLRTCQDIGVTSAQFYSDSKLIVGQVQGMWKVREKSLIPLRHLVWELAESFDHVEISWIPRNENKESDRACREVLKPPVVTADRKRPVLVRRTADRKRPSSAPAETR